MINTANSTMTTTFVEPTEYRGVATEVTPVESPDTTAPRMDADVQIVRVDPASTGIVTVSFDPEEASRRAARRRITKRFSR